MIVVFFEALWWGVVVTGFLELLLELVLKLVDTPNIFVSFFQAFGFTVTDGSNKALCNDS